MRKIKIITDRKLEKMDIKNINYEYFLDLSVRMKQF